MDNNQQLTVNDIETAKPFVAPIEPYGTVVKVYDGDTITVVAKLQLQGSPYYKFSIRLAGIDTPEIRGANREAAIEARDALANKIMHKKVEITNVKTEKYGRLLADIHIDGLHINQWLINEGYAKPYFGGKKE